MEYNSAQLHLMCAVLRMCAGDKCFHLLIEVEYCCW